MAKESLVCAGEVLWDCLPDGDCIGGAPFNVAAHAARLGWRARLVSRVGDDGRGSAARRLAVRNGIDVGLLQTDPLLPTGVAHAQLDAAGNARYRFLAPVAWDAIEATPAALDAVARADAFVYGTLAQRDARSRAALLRLIGAARFRVYDPNLREPHVDRAVALASLEQADLAKFNETECQLFCDWIGCTVRAEALHAALRTRFGVRSLCITRGAAGAVLFHGGRRYDQPAVPADVVDTVGAGDAFLAMLCVQLLGHAAPADALRRAARLAAHVVAHRGALPQYQPDALLA
ncbi:MAG: carbohydrate kinase [Gammaproteobacteria bacterium]|nr:carbohydrate kinase [Gammaproteobacteria bacterium]